MAGGHLIVAATIFHFPSIACFPSQVLVYLVSWEIEQNNCWMLMTTTDLFFILAKNLNAAFFIAPQILTSAGQWGWLVSAALWAISFSHFVQPGKKSLFQNPRNRSAGTKEFAALPSFSFRFLNHVVWYLYSLHV